MKYPLYCIRDVKVGFLAPQADQSDQSAIRNFSYAVNGNNGIMNFSPKDFDLYKVGEFDSEDGSIVSYIPDMICGGIDVYGDKE